VKVLEASVDRLCGAVARAWSVEVGQDVGGSLLQGPPERDEPGQRAGNVGADRVDQASMSWRRLARSGSR